MAPENKPQIFGPEAGNITGPAEYEPTPEEIAEEQAWAQLGEEALAALLDEEEKNTSDPMFPFGKPENIDYATIDQAGVPLLQELNKRPWIKTVEYCSGHPLNRNPEEVSELYPMVSGENVYDEIQKLDMALIRGAVPEAYHNWRKRELQRMGRTRFYLNVNVYSMNIFLDWTRLAASMLVLATNTGTNPLIVRFNPTRPGVNFSIYWDYWTLEERALIHTILLDTLTQYPI